MSENRYFLGGSSPDGFRTHFGDIVGDTDYHTYIIKGGPGTGKSTLMKKLAAAYDGDKDIYFCSSDPDSYDAVVFRESKAVIVDGTAPHVFEPEYPGAVQEIVDLGAYWDSVSLQQKKKEILLAQEKYSRHHLRCKRYISGAASVLSDTLQITEAAADKRRIEGFTGRLAKKVLPSKSSGLGRLLFRQMSALTPKGYITFIPENDTVYLLNDSGFSATDIFLRGLAELALIKGLEVHASECLLMKNSVFEHLRIPALEISFISCSAVNNIRLDSKNPVNMNRFYDKAMLADKKNRLKFNMTAVRELVSEAQDCLKCAKADHDVLESFYIDAVDFKKSDKMLKKLAEKIG